MKIVRYLHFSTDDSKWQEKFHSFEGKEIFFRKDTSKRVSVRPVSKVEARNLAGAVKIREREAVGAEIKMEDRGNKMEKT